MAKPTMTNEELQIKRRARRRLIGAVTLVTGLVVFLPMVLDNEPKPVAEDITINIPSQEHSAAKSGAISSSKSPAPEKPAPKNEVTPHAPPEALPPPSPTAVAKTEPPPAKPVAPPARPVADPVDEPPPKAAPEPPSPPPPPPKPAPSPKPTQPAPVKAAQPAPAAPAKPTEVATPSSQEGFVVRLGAFSKPENAKQLKAKIALMGIRNYMDTVKTDAGEKTLVRAGPFGTRREAEMVRDRLKAVDLDGDVVPR